MRHRYNPLPTRVTTKQRKRYWPVVANMTYAFLTIRREENGQQVVRRPRATDVIGHALRGAFDDTHSIPDDMMMMLRRLDAMPHRLN